MPTSQSAPPNQPAPPGPLPAGYGIPPQPRPAYPASHGAPTAVPGYGGPGYGPVPGQHPAPYGYAQPGGGYRFPPPSPPLSPNGQPLAGFGDRLLALLVDSLIDGAITLLLVFPALIIFFVTRGPELFEVTPDGTLRNPNLFANLFLPILAIEYGALLVSLIFLYLYHVEFTLRRGQTLGKKIMKIRIAPLDPAATLSRGMLARRFLVQSAASRFIPFLSYIDGFWQLWDKPYQQCLHDKFARTVVVKVPG